MLAFSYIKGKVYMKDYLDKLTEHLKEVAKRQFFSSDTSAIEKKYQELRTQFITDFFRKLSEKCNANFQYYEEHGDFVLFSIRYRDPRFPNGDDPSKYKLFPFYVEVSECIGKKRATENLDMVESLWIEQLSAAVGEEYNTDKQEYESKTKGPNID